jgi:uncharacterized protein (DUF2147 family)
MCPIKKTGFNMKKLNLISLLFALIFCGTAGALPLTGYYQTIDDMTHKPKSIVALYEYKDGDMEKLAARIIVLYDQEGNGTITETLNAPKRIADTVAGQPKMAGMDIMWKMEWDADDAKYSGGRIIDPKRGKIYRCSVWQDEDKTKLQVRGKIGPFGRTQTWNVMQVSDLPSDVQNLNIKSWTPVVIE